MPPDLAKSFYEEALKKSAQLGVPTQGGVFGADMKLHLINDGPVTFIL
jgi:D-tyrosyl-tRNA(Tyr) deacylase